jgi:hypothetical protein
MALATVAIDAAIDAVDDVCLTDDECADVSGKLMLLLAKRPFMLMLAVSEAEEGAFVVV